MLTIPIASPRFLAENHMAGRVIIGTGTPPFPKPVISLVKKAKEKESESPVRNRPTPVTRSDKKMMFLAPNR